MMFDDLIGNIEIMAYNLKEQGIEPEDVEVVFTKSSGKHILALLKDESVIDYMRW